MANEKHLIYADPVYEELRKSYEELKRIRETLTCHEDIQICNAQLATYKEAMQCIKDAPTVDAVEVVHGKWINNGGHRKMDLCCSVCNRRASNFVGGYEDWWDLWFPKYCPNCGAKMDGDGNG